jgi:hypothetical protein
VTPCTLTGSPCLGNSSCCGGGTCSAQNVCTGGLLGQCMAQ